MPKDSAALAAQALFCEAGEISRPVDQAVVVDLDDVAARRERLVAYAEATRAVIVYRFIMPDGAMVDALGPSGRQRDARAQLQLLVALSGGAIGPSVGGLAARIPTRLAQKFEALARPLIEAHLVSLDLGEAG